MHWNAYNISGIATQVAEATSNHGDQIPVGRVEGSVTSAAPVIAGLARHQAVITTTSPFTR
ncbi:MAG TPA: hypothetical protein VHL14_03740 [Steroidobacteraceae bacterium]|nr:hypothetical protein [Steroidobacteraceae bacterium]